MRILVVASCTKSKRKYPTWASQLYTGRLIKLTNQTVKATLDRGIRVDYFILSAKHAFVPSGEVLRPYNETFEGLSAAATHAKGDAMRLPQRARMLINRSVYDRVFLLLGRNYQRACRLNEIDHPRHITTIYSPSKDLKWPLDPNWDYIPAGNAQAKEFGGGATGVKAVLLGRDLAQLPSRRRGFPLEQGKVHW